MTNQQQPKLVGLKTAKPAVLLIGPLIDVINDLIANGDQIISIEAVYRCDDDFLEGESFVTVDDEPTRMVVTY